MKKISAVSNLLQANVNPKFSFSKYSISIGFLIKIRYELIYDKNIKFFIKLFHLLPYRFNMKFNFQDKESDDSD